MSTHTYLLKPVVALLLLFSFKLAYAVVPDTLNYQAYLTDDTGVAVDGPVSIVFSIYNVDAGGIPLWSDTQAVTVDNGVLSVELGGPLNPFPTGLFNTPLWMGLTVDTDAEMTPRRPISSVGFSFKASDADTLDGNSASALDQSAHVIDTSNPHNVTAAQVGSVSDADFTAHKGDASAHHAKTTTFPELTGQIADAQIPALIARDAELTWSNLGGIPVGFADGIDNDSGGDITSVTAGTGLTGGGLIGALTLGIQVPLNLSNSAVDPVIYGNNPGGFLSSSGVKGEGANGPTRGYLGVVGGTDFDGIVGLNTSGQEIGVMGVSTGGSVADNFGLYGYSNNIGIYASGTTAAGEFDGDVNVTGTLGITGSVNVSANIGSSGTGSVNGLTLGSDQTTATNIYHLTTATRIDGPNDRLQYGSVEYIQDCGGNCTEIGWDLNVTGNYVTVDGLGNEQAYIGGDGSGSDVQLGSANAAITAVALWNRSTASRMDLFVRQLHIMGGADLAEPFDVSDEIEIEPGMIVSIDPDQPGLLKLAEQAYDRMVAGIVSGANGINPGVTMMQEGSDAEGSVSVALTGRVYALVDASYGAIEPGDLLTTSDTPGYAMKVTDHARSQGSIIGKAMSSLTEGKGHVLVLVTLQ